MRKSEWRSILLFIIALLAVIETVWHLSEWIWVFHEGERSFMLEAGSFAFLILLSEQFVNHGICLYS
jgi:hypothetical protein